MPPPGPNLGLAGAHQPGPPRNGQIWPSGTPPDCKFGLNLGPGEGPPRPRGPGSNHFFRFRAASGVCGRLNLTVWEGGTPRPPRDPPPGPLQKAGSHTTSRFNYSCESLRRRGLTDHSGRTGPGPFTPKSGLSDLKWLEVGQNRFEPLYTPMYTY